MAMPYLNWLHRYAHPLATGNPMQGLAGLGVMPPNADLPALLPALTGPPAQAPTPPALPINAIPLSQPMSDAQAGLYLGAGIVPIPANLARKIWNLEYVELSQLLPEAWLFEDQPRNHCCEKKQTRKAEIKSIFVWLQAYGTLVSVLCHRFPGKIAQLMAYQATIVRCYSDFEGDGWMAYDRAFRRQMAAVRSLDWSELNSTLYNLCFAGRAKRDMVCASCLSRNHKTADCPDSTSSFSSKRLDRRSLRGQDRSERSVEICRLYNARGAPKCHFKYAHLCIEYRRPHPVSSCPSGSRAPSEPAKRLKTE